MADAKKLPACKTCRQRKVKCDRQQPGCQKCKEAGWKCPGYIVALKFRDQSDKFRSKSSSTANTASPPASSNTSSALSTSPSSLISTWSLNPPTLSETTDHGNGHSTWQAIAPAPSPASVPWVRTDFLRYAFAQVLETRRLNADLTFISVYPSASLMTERIGSSPTLDAAIICACKKSHFAPNEAIWRKPYVRALRALQDALKQPAQATQTETLGASLLLMTLDHYAVEEDADAWKRHAQGLVRLVEHRGPTAFNSELDLSILQAASGHIVFGAVEQGRDCFLDTPAWHSFFARFEPGAQAAATSPSAYASELHLLSLYTPWPGLLNAYTNVIMRPASPSSFSLLENESRIVDVKDLLQRLLTQRAAVITWTQTFPLTADPSASADERVPLRLGFEASMAQFLVFLDCMAARALEELPDGMVLDPTLTPQTVYQGIGGRMAPWNGSLKSLLVEEAVSAKEDAREKTLLLKARNRHSFQGVRNAMIMSLDRVMPFDRPPRAAAALREMAVAWGYFDPAENKSANEPATAHVLDSDWLDSLFENDPAFALVGSRASTSEGTEGDGEAEADLNMHVADSGANFLSEFAVL